jgi:hypothetical protein
MKTTPPRDQVRERCARLSIAFAALALVLTLAGEGSADTPEERRTDLLKGAASALRKGQPLQAIAKWRAAWDIRPAPDVACDIGTGEFLYGSQAAAAEFLSICEREYSATSPRDKERIEEVKKRLGKAREQVGALNVDVEENGATVLIDGRDVGRAPLKRTVFVEPGAHRIEVVLEGYNRQEVVSSVERGEERSISIKLTRIAPSKPVLRVAPIHPLPAPIPAPAPGGPDIPLAIAGGALAIVGAGIGVGFTAVANHAANEGQWNRAEMKWSDRADCDAAALQPLCPGYVSAEEARRHHARIATTAFVGAGLFTVATIAYVAFPRAFARPAGRMSGAALTVYQWQ